MTPADFRRSDARQANFARLAADIARRARFRCPKCGSVDGMEKWTPWDLADSMFHELPEVLYRRPEDAVNLYERCELCSEHIPADYVPLTVAEIVQVWDRARFDCVGLD